MRSVSVTSATTRHTQSLPHLSRQSAYLVRPQQVIRSAESRLDYRIERLLGAGGFGQVFLASRLGRSGTVPQVVCVKVSAFIDGWVREAYFGDLLGTHERAIRIYDRFPIARDDGRTVFRDDVYGRDARMIAAMFPGPGRAQLASTVRSIAKR